MNAAQQSIGTDVIEEWRDISGFEGLYQVSSLGRIKSLARKVTAPRGRSWFLAARIMSPGFTRKGYWLEEPTPEMVDAAVKRGEQSGYTDVVGIWKAMLAAKRAEVRQL